MNLGVGLGGVWNEEKHVTRQKYFSENIASSNFLGGAGMIFEDDDGGDEIPPARRRLKSCLPLRGSSFCVP